MAQMMVFFGAKTSELMRMLMEELDTRKQSEVVRRALLAHWKLEADFPDRVPYLPDEDGPKNIQYHIRLPDKIHLLLLQERADSYSRTIRLAIQCLAWCVQIRKTTDTKQCQLEDEKWYAFLLTF